MFKKIFFFIFLAALVSGSLAMAQTTGEIEGMVVDTQGLAMPGVAVTMTGEAVLGQQVAVTLEDGSYRFRGLRRGTASSAGTG